MGQGLNPQLLVSSCQLCCASCSLKGTLQATFFLQSPTSTYPRVRRCTGASGQRRPSHSLCPAQACLWELPPREPKGSTPWMQGPCGLWPEAASGEQRWEGVWIPGFPGTRWVAGGGEGQPLLPILALTAAVITKPIMPESHHDDFRTAL